MPQIEILPNSTTTSSTPGWAYVPDTGYDPSKAAIITTGSRKRTNRAAHLGASGSGAGGGDELSVREQNKINAYLEHLQKDSLKDVQIVLHNKARDLASRGLRGKMTPGVRRVIQSQKTFANHLADEEAALAHHGAAEQPAANSSSASAPQKARGQTARQQSSSAPAADAMEIDQPSAQLPPAAPPHADGNDELFHDPGLPAAPTEEEIDALLAQPALSYTAARAAPSARSAPARRFCSMCGYFGTVRCVKCNARVCGLECKLAHDEGKCLKF